MSPAAHGRTRGPSVDELEAGIRANDRTLLARAITLVESRRPEDRRHAQDLLARLLPETGRSTRIGITGVPGVGKSTFIDAFGCLLIEEGRRVAVLAVDPSSLATGGSILGDKTRMERLARAEEAFIRPSATAGTLGGVAQATREAMLLCEAAGFDTILVETVGVGQSETLVSKMVDFFLLLMLPGAGDELQGIKRGIVELADMLAVNKADGDNVKRAERASKAYARALSILRSRDSAPPTVHTCSGSTGAGLPEIWKTIESRLQDERADGTFDARRRRQRLDWFDDLTRTRLTAHFERSPGVRAARAALAEQVAEDELTASQAADRLVQTYLDEISG